MPRAVCGPPPAQLRERERERAAPGAGAGGQPAPPAARTTHSPRPGPADYRALPPGARGSGGTASSGSCGSGFPSDVLTARLARALRAAPRARDPLERCTATARLSWESALGRAGALWALPHPLKGNKQKTTTLKNRFKNLQTKAESLK